VQISLVSYQNENHPISLSVPQWLRSPLLFTAHRRPADAQAKQERTEHRKGTHKIQMPIVEALTHIYHLIQMLQALWNCVCLRMCFHGASVWFYWGGYVEYVC